MSDFTAEMFTAWSHISHNIESKNFIFSRFRLKMEERQTFWQFFSSLFWINITSNAWKCWIIQCVYLKAYLSFFVTKYLFIYICNICLFSWFFQLVFLKAMLRQALRNVWVCICTWSVLCYGSDIITLKLKRVISKPLLPVSDGLANLLVANKKI